MAISDVGSGLQIGGGLIELATILWGATTVRRALAQHLYEDMKQGYDNLVEQMAYGVTRDVEGGKRASRESVRQRLDWLNEALR